MSIKSSKIVILCLVIVLCGCQDNLLEPIPHDRITSRVFWKQKKDGIEAANAIYTFLDGTDALHRDVFSDIAHTNTQYGDYKYIEIGTYDALNSVIENEWDRSYKGIRAANYFLENVDKIATDDKDFINRLKGEVRVIRAYLYTNLVFIYGNIPLITKTLSLNEAKNVDQAPPNEVWDFIEKELTGAANQLPITTSEEGKITKGAALALKARAMLYAKQFQKAADAAKKVMDLGVYKIYKSYKNLFSYEAENNSEVILNKEFMKDTYPNDVFSLYAPFSLASNGVVVVPLKKIVDSYQMTNGKDIGESGSGFDLSTPYENRDPRLQYSVYVPGSTLPNGDIFDSRPNKGTLDAVGSNYQVSVTGFNVRKYVSKKDIDEGNNSGLNIILVRYAEVLLTYAEAKVELNQIDTSVFDAINKVRQRPDVNMPAITQPKTQDQLRKIVRHERMVELAFEGQRFFDIRRWDIAEQVFPKPIRGLTYKDNNGQFITVDQPSFVRTFKPADYLWPIPKKELELNHALNQNPGWGSR